MYLLDTNILSESRKLGNARIDPHLAKWLAQIDVEASYISAMTIYEIKRGVQRMEGRDAKQGAVLRRWLDEQILVIYQHRTLSLTREVALICAGLHVPDPKPERDAWIAASAIHAGLTLATRNVADFAGMGVRLINPFEYEK